MNLDELEKFITFEFKKIYKAYLKVSYHINSKYTGIHDSENNQENLIVVSDENQYLNWRKK